MCKSRIIVSAHVEGNTMHQNVVAHSALLYRLSKLGTLAHAIGHFDGKQELSVVVDLEPQPFMCLANVAYTLAQEYKQQSVYLSKDGKAFLATKGGDLITLGLEREKVMHVTEPWGTQDYTYVLGADLYIWTENEK